MGVAIPDSDEERDTDGGSGVGGDDEMRKKSRATAAILVRTRGPLSSWTAEQKTNEVTGSILLDKWSWIDVGSSKDHDDSVATAWIKIIGRIEIVLSTRRGLPTRGIVYISFNSMITHARIALAIELDSVYLPAVFMPTVKHFFRRQYGHQLRLALSTKHAPMPAEKFHEIATICF